MSIFTMLSAVKQRNFKPLYMLLLVAAFISLISAYCLEYVMHLAPCIFCLYQRYCYFVLIVFSGYGLFINKHRELTNRLVGLTLLAACLIAGYHAGIERGIFAASSFCTANITIPDNLSISEVKDMLDARSMTPCNLVAFRIFKLSLSEWNLLLNIGLILLLVTTSKVK